MKSLLAILITLTLFAGTSAAQTKIYVSVSGNDKNPGTKSQPLASLKGAFDKLKNLPKEQITFIVEDGDYYMTEPLELGPEFSGSSQFPIVVKAEEGAKPSFIGGKTLPPFRKVSDNLWKTHIPEAKQFGWKFEQLYVNGRRAVRAKTPNSDFFFLKGVSETILFKGQGRSPEFASQRLTLFPEGVKEISKFETNEFDDAIITFYHKWDNTRKRIAGFEPDSSFIFTTGEGMKPWNRMDPQTRYVIENYRAALDSPGEWFLDNTGDLYYIPLEGESIDKTIAIAPVTEQLMVFKGTKARKVSNLHFEGLAFKVTDYRTPVNGNEPAQAAYPIEAAIMADYADNIKFRNCEVTLTGTNAFWFREACADCGVEQSYLHDLGAGGVKIGHNTSPGIAEGIAKEVSSKITIDNNIIRSGGYVFPCAVGVTLFHAGDCQITHNEIANFRYSGVSVGWVWGYTFSPSKRNIIEYNHIHHIGWGELCDMGGVYCLGLSEGTSVSNNVIHDIYSFDYGGWGLYTDEGSTGIVMENNLVYNCKSSGFHQHYGKENIIRNNIFYNNIKAQLQATRVEEHLSFTFSNNIICHERGTLLSSNWGKIRLETDNNCYWDSRTKDIRFGGQSFQQWQQSGKDKNSIIANPDFVNPSEGDFKVRNKQMMRKIGFKEFDYSKAGVYGADEWKKLAEFDTVLARKFDEAVEKNEARK